MTRVDLPRTRDARDAGERAEGERGVDALQVVLASVLDAELARRPAPLLGHRDRPAGRPGTARSSECDDLLDLRGRALGDDLAPMLAGAGSEVDQVVGRVHRAFVVLDDHDGVAQVAQALEGADQLLVVALVEADRRLVEDVHDADETGADLRREPDALRLAAGERGGGALEREVADPDRLEEVEALLRPRGGSASRSPTRSRSARAAETHSSAALPTGG